MATKAETITSLSRAMVVMMTVEAAVEGVTT